MTTQTTPEMTSAEATAMWEVLWGPDPTNPADPALVTETHRRLDRAEAERANRAAALVFLNFYQPANK